MIVDDLRAACDWNRALRVIRAVPKELNDRAWRPLKGRYVERALANNSKGRFVMPKDTEIGYDLMWKAKTFKIESKYVRGLFRTPKGKTRTSGSIKSVVLKNTLGDVAAAKYAVTFDILVLSSNDGIGCVTAATLAPYIRRREGQYVLENLPYSKIQWLVHPDDAGVAEPDQDGDIISHIDAALDKFQEKIA